MNNPMSLSNIDGNFVNVAVFRQNEAPHIEAIIDELQWYQQLVGGYVEMVPLPGTVYTLVCNEEGLLKDLPPNKYVRIYDSWQLIRGNFFITRVRNGEFLPTSTIDLALLTADFVRDAL